ncbi:TonB-dependent receptor, partial [Streptomyces coelicoflavus ZG0656]
LVWSPVEDLSFKASWGTSFRAPSLNELNEAVVIGATATTEGGVEKLAVIQLGGNPDLGPETAETFTAGFEFAPSGDWRIGASFFDVRFEDRIGRPIVENIDNALVDPNLSAFVTRVDPAVPGDLAAINVLINDPRFVPPGAVSGDRLLRDLRCRWLNTGELRVQGVDLSAGRTFEVGANRIDLDATASWL